MVHIDTPSGLQVRRCAKHYIAEVDRENRSATSELFKKYIGIEREKKLKMGLEYEKHVIQQIRQVIGRMGIRG